MVDAPRAFVTTRISYSNLPNKGDYLCHEFKTESDKHIDTFDHKRRSSSVA